MSGVRGDEMHDGNVAPSLESPKVGSEIYRTRKASILDTLLKEVGTPADIIDKTGLSPSEVSTYTKQLVFQGYLERVPMHYKLTAKAKKEHEHLHDWPPSVTERYTGGDLSKAKSSGNRGAKLQRRPLTEVVRKAVSTLWGLGGRK